MSQYEEDFDNFIDERDKRQGSVEIEGIVKIYTDKAILLEDKDGISRWFPRSQLRGVVLRDSDLNKMMDEESVEEFLIPRWLYEDKFENDEEDDWED